GKAGLCIIHLEKLKKSGRGRALITNRISHRCTQTNADGKMGLSGFSCVHLWLTHQPMGVIRTLYCSVPRWRSWPLTMDLPSGVKVGKYAGTRRGLVLIALPAAESQRMIVPP